MSHASWLVPPCMTATGARPGKKSNHSSRSTPTERQHDARPCVRRSAGERPLACRAPPRKASHLAAKKKQAAFHVAFCVRFVPTRTTPLLLSWISRPARPHPRATISHPTTHMLMQAQSSRTSAATASPPAGAAVAPQVSAPSNPHLAEKHVSPPSKIPLLL
jgi:hypothetical protein